MPAPIANKNQSRSKPWTDALRRALARFDDDGKIEAGQALNRIADQYVKTAFNGDKDAIAEIANRLDGKPAQSVAIDEDSGPLTIEIVKRIVKSSD